MSRIYIIAGEQSGDVLGARLIRALRAERSGLEFSGIGGPRMEELGFHSLFPMRELAVMGLLEVLPKLRTLRRRLQETIADIHARKPDVLVTIDSPGFTLRVLKACPEIKRVHYVAPQVWAWKPKRVHEFPGLWDRLLCLLPFEPDWFAQHGLEGRFVGHPVLESGADTGNAARFRARHAIAADAPVLILMPGSRRSEVPRLLPVFAHTLELLAPRLPGLVPVVPVASAVADTVRAATSGWKVPPVIVTELDVRDQRLPASVSARDTAVAAHARAWLDAVLPNPAVLGVLSWGLSDRASWLNDKFARPDGLKQRGLPLDEDLGRKKLWTALANSIDSTAPRPAPKG